MRQQLIIIDSNYLCYVQKFALSHGLTYRGSRTEIIYGFVKNILELAKKFNTNNFAFCWDSKLSKRRGLYPKYKYKRREKKSDAEEEADEIAYAQFDKLRYTVLPHLGFSNVFYQDGYESDDLIASLLQGYDSHWMPRPVVVTNDHDLYQLLDKCSLYNIVSHETTTESMFQRQHSIDASLWADVKTISGCVTDNVPGVVGVGDKTAIRYLQGKLTKGKIFDAIKKRSLNDRILTEYLVKLPFPDTEECYLIKNYLTMERYEYVCRRFDFQSLLSPKKKMDWDNYLVKLRNDI